MSQEDCELSRERWEALKRDIARGIEAADRGEIVPGEEVFRELRERSAQIAKRK
jgi:predicted transcriptional regulator